MTYFSDSQEAVSRFGDYIGEFQHAFRSSDVDYGTPDDFFAFARALPYDAQLRGSVSVLAKSVMARENKVPLRTILTIIAVASGGPEVATSERDMSKPVNLLIDFLIKVGGCSQMISELPDIPASEIPTADATDRVLTSDLFPADERVSAEQISLTRFPSEEPVSNTPADRSPQDYAASSNTLTESLTRLEMNSLQLKLYLDSIDQRISRMEPRLESVPPLVVSNPAPHPRDRSEARFSAAIPPEAQPQPPRKDPPRPAQPPVEAIRRPALHSQLWTKSRRFFLSFPSRRQISLPIILAFGALLLFALFLWSFGRGTTHADVHPARITGNEPANADFALPAPSATPTVSDQPASISSLQPDTASQGTIHPGVTANHPSKISAAIPFSHTPKSASTPVPATATPPPTLTADATDTSGLSDSDTATSPPRARGHESTSVSQSGRLVNVSSGVMAANLLEAPMPTYPRLASLTHMQGNVVMQAIISKDGTVESVHVIKGHRLLRNAATNAVRTWQYRPYLVNGRPVEVATIVSVDFTLQH